MRSKLFVPGSRPELFEKALASAADALSFDLEDAVAPAKKAEARAAVSAFVQERMAESPKISVVRVNAVSTPLFAADVEALVGRGVEILNIPKLESAGDVLAAISTIERLESNRGLRKTLKILANIETPKALRLAVEIATSSPRIMGLQIGLIDLCSTCGIDPNDQAAVQTLRLGVRMAAAEAGIPTYDSAFANIKDVEGFRESALAARRLGFSGKSCIHPSQIAAANQVFSPRADEIAYAQNVLATAAETSEGAFTVDGQMVDAPVIARARAILALAAANEGEAPPKAT